MKKILIVAVTFTAVLAVWRQSAPAPAASLTQPKAGIESKPEVLANTPATSATKITESATSPTGAIARAVAPSTTEFEALLRNRSLGELQSEATKSEAISTALVQKWNDGAFTEADVTALTAEVRKQAVIAREVASLKIAAINRKYQ